MDIKTRAIHSTAVFSGCRKYRYTLERKFCEATPGMVNFIMLNPSTATEEFNDPTVSRCESITLLRGYGNMVVTNIFAYRATDPLAMKAMEGNAIGTENDKHILEVSRRANLVVCAWGNHGGFLNRGKAVLNMLQNAGIKPHCIKISGTGQPVHPLYQKINSELKVI